MQQCALADEYSALVPPHLPRCSQFPF